MIPFWALRHEFVHHLNECPAIGGNGDGDCTCGAVDFLRGLDAVDAEITRKRAPAPQTIEHEA